MNVLLPSDFNGEVFKNNKINRIQLVFIICGVLSLLCISFSCFDITREETIAYAIGCVYATLYLVCFFSVDREFLLKRKSKENLEIKTTQTNIDNINKDITKLTDCNDRESK